MAINSQCQLKIIDFGLARYGIDGPECLDEEKQQHQGWMRMTPYVMLRNYRAPEIFFKMNYNENGFVHFWQYSFLICLFCSADVWSIGCILAELFLGHCLFEDNNDLALIKSIVKNLGTPDASFIEQILPEKRKILKQFEYKAKSMDKILPKSELPKDHPTDDRFSGE